MKTGFAQGFRCLSLTTVLLMGLAQMASAASVALRVEKTEGSGSSVEAPISTGKCEGLGALQFHLTYDPAIVEPEAVEAGKLLTSGLVEFKVLEPGLLSIAMISSAPVDESGELLKVRFKLSAAEGGSTDLGIAEEKAWDYENNLEMLVTAEGGSLTLKPGAASVSAGAIPNVDGKSMILPIAIGGAVLLVLLLIVVITLAKKGKGAPAPTASSASAAGAPQANFCQKCGTRLEAGARFCPSCGNAIGK